MIILIQCMYSKVGENNTENSKIVLVFHFFVCFFFLQLSLFLQISQQRQFSLLKAIAISFSLLFGNVFKREKEQNYCYRNSWKSDTYVESKQRKFLYCYRIAQKYFAFLVHQFYFRRQYCTWHTWIYFVPLHLGCAFDFSYMLQQYNGIILNHKLLHILLSFLFLLSASFHGWIRNKRKGNISEL